MTGRNGGQPGHAALVEVRREARELPRPLASGPWGQPAMRAQERGVLGHRRPRPRRRWLRHPPDASPPTSVLVGVEEDPNCRPHEAASTRAESDDSVRDVLRYLRGIEGEREPELLRLEVARHPQPLSQMLRRDLGVVPLLDQALADPIDPVDVDQVLSDGRGVAPAAECVDDQLAVGLARARLRRSTGPLRGDGCGVVRALASRRGRRRVGGHLRGNGRICRTSGRAATAAHGQAGRFQVTAGGLAPDPGGLFDPPQRPAEASRESSTSSGKLIHRNPDRMARTVWIHRVCRSRNRELGCQLGCQSPKTGLISVFPKRTMLFIFSKLRWCRGPESNWRHHDFQSCALPTELPRHAGGRGTRQEIPRYRTARTPRKACAGRAWRPRRDWCTVGIGRTAGVPGAGLPCTTWRGIR